MLTGRIQTGNSNSAHGGDQESGATKDFDSASLRIAVKLTPNRVRCRGRDYLMIKLKPGHACRASATHLVHAGGLVIVTLAVLLAMGLVGADHEPGFLVQRAVNDDEVPMA
jgi:hypothetical protein